MKSPSYLYLAPSGVYHFRQRQGKRTVKCSLYTTDLTTARLLALSYAVAMKKQPPALVEILAKPRRDYRLTRGADGSLTIEANGAEDHAMALEAIGKLPTTFPSFPDLATSKLPAMTLGKAVRLYLADIKPSTKLKTYKIKQSAIESFASHYGESKQLATVDRLEVGHWVMALKAGGNINRTIDNKCIYLAGFLTWAKGKGFYPKFAKEDNPAKGQVKYGKAEKRNRKGYGTKPFDLAQIQTLYDPANFRKLSPNAKWGSLIGLYTGARVSEIGQLALADFVDKDGIPCFAFTDEGEHQSLKTEPSKRTVPLHPHLIQLGLLDKVEELRKQGKTRFFYGTKEDGINGQGNWLTKAFGYYWKKLLPKPPKGTYGTHSLRKGIIQALQDLGTPAERRVDITGHELGDEHHQSYSRKSTPKELLKAIKPLGWKLDLEGLKRLL